MHARKAWVNVSDNEDAGPHIVEDPFADPFAD